MKVKAIPPSALHVREVDPPVCSAIPWCSPSFLGRLHQLEHIPLLLELVPPQAVGPAGSLGHPWYLQVLPVEGTAAGDDFVEAAAGDDLGEAASGDDVGEAAAGGDLGEAAAGNDLGEASAPVGTLK